MDTIDLTSEQGLQKFRELIIEATFWLEHYSFLFYLIKTAEIINDTLVGMCNCFFSFTFHSA
jgi:hypothetical protein